MKRNEVAKIILSGLAITGGVIVLAALPGLATALAPFVRGNRKPNYLQFKKSLNKLSNNGLVGISQDGDKTILRLTKEGEQKILKYKLDELKIQKPVKWDRKWRVLIFDIPEKFKQSRDALVIKLKEMGFMRIQKSVWICPYPCEDEADFVTELYNVRQFVQIMLVEKLDKQKNLLKVFGLID